VILPGGRSPAVERVTATGRPSLDIRRRMAVLFLICGDENGAARCWGRVAGVRRQAGHVATMRRRRLR
jgi:hypothetical protein